MFAIVNMPYLVNSLWGPCVWGSDFQAISEKWLLRCRDVLKREPDPAIDLPWLREFRDVHIPGFLSDCLRCIQTSHHLSSSNREGKPFDDSLDLSCIFTCRRYIFYTLLHGIAFLPDVPCR